MQVRTENRFDGALQLEQREVVGHQLEDDRAIFDLRAHAANSSRKYAPMIEAHRQPKARSFCPMLGGVAAIADGLFDKPGLVEQLITLENFLFVPRRTVERKTDAHAFLRD